MTTEQAKFRLSALCSTAEHCQGEMLKKMRTWELTEEQQAEVMKFLLDERYVDDERYARAYAKEKRLYSGWGPRKIEQGLYMKQVERSIITTVLAEVDDEQYIEVLKPAIASKRRTVKGATDYERNGKLIRFALGRGFTYDQVKACISEVDEYDI